MPQIKQIIKKPVIKLALLAVVLLLSFGYLRHNFSARASDEQIKLYPQSFSQEGNGGSLSNPAIKSGFLWQSPENAMTAEQGQSADASSFNETNSAVLNFGQGMISPVSTSSVLAVPTSTVSAEPVAATGTEVEINSSSTPSADTLSPSGLNPVSADQESSSESSGTPADSSLPESDNPAVENHLPENNPLAAPSSDDSAPADNFVPEENDNSTAPAASGSTGTDDSAPAAPAPVPIDVDQPVDSNAAAGPVSILHNFNNTAGEIAQFWQNLTSASRALAADATASAPDLSAPQNSSSEPELKDSLIFSNFTVDSYSPASEITNVQLRLSLSAQSSFTFDHILVEYSTGGDWQTAGDLFLKGSASNAANGGYFLYALPIFSSWDDVNNLRVRLSYENSELSAADLQAKAAKVYLDGIWLEVDYNQGLVKGAREKYDDSNGQTGQEKHFFNDAPLVINGQVIDFPYTDATTSESLIIKTDRQNYTGLESAPVYLSVTNTGTQSENFGLQAYFPDNNSGNMTGLEKLDRHYVENQAPIKSDIIFYCAAGWQSSSTVPEAESSTIAATASSSNLSGASSTKQDYSCPGKNRIRSCDSLSADQKKCEQFDAVVGSSTEMDAVDQWQPTGIVPGRLADKRNLLQKIFNLGPHRKTVPSNFAPRESTPAGQFNIAPGETEYFKMDISFTPESKGEFYLETVGDKSGYGLLDPWWNASWNYYVPVTVTYAGSNPLTNFQVPVTINTATLIAGAKMKADCSDIAFADSNLYSDNSELYYYLEPATCNTAYTKVWVKIPSLSATKTIYLLYGNSAATSYSSGANTFVYFNDFESSIDFNAGLLNPTRTAKSARYGSFGLNANGATHGRLETISGSASGRNLIWESWIKGESSSSVSALAGITVGHPNGNTYAGYQAIIDRRATHYLAITKNYATTSPLVFANTAIADNTWYFLQFSWRSTGVLWATLYAGSTSTVPISSCSSTDATYSNGEYGVAANQIGDWDGYRIRKYASSSVTSALGSETAIINHAPTNPSALQQYYNGTSTVISNGSWINKNNIYLYSTSSDKDTNLMSIYYQLATTGVSFLTATSAPANACAVGTAYNSCASRVWSTALTPGWLNYTYKYRTPITVLASKIQGTLTQFPVYFNLARLGASNQFWSHTKRKSDGGDLMITNSDGLTQVPLEVASISTSTHTGEIYFRADSLSSAANTVYYLYYGSSTAAQPASTTAYGSQNVWSNGYSGVWHLNEAAGSTRVKDSTQYNNSSSSLVGAPVLASAGKLGTSAYFNGTNRILVEESASLQPASFLTFSIWMNGDATQNGWAHPIWYGPNTATPYGVYGFQYDNASQTDLNARVSSAATAYTTTDFTTTAGNWYEMTGVYDGNAVMYYANGNLINSVPWVGGTIGPYDSVNGLGIGNRYQSGQGFTGYVDEVRISSGARSAAWISTEYGNQNNPGAFFSTSSEQTFTSLYKFAGIPAVPDSSAGYRWQAIACDGSELCSNWSIFNTTQPNFKMDAMPPVFSNTVGFLASTTNSLKISFPAPASEVNFSQYKLFYQVGSAAPIHENATWSITSSTPGFAYLGSLNYSGKVNASTTLTGLATGTVYSFSLWGYDNDGNKSSSSLSWEMTDRYPAVAFNSAAEQTNGSGGVNISLAVNDVDLDNQVMAKVEYFTDQYCHSATNKPTLDPTSVTASYNPPVLQNKNIYQIGTSTGWIFTSAGANSVNFVWQTKTDIPAANGLYCLKVTVNDNRGGYSSATTSLIVDNVLPSIPGSLTFNRAGGTFIIANFTGATTESHFYQYKIYYKPGTIGVKETNPYFGSSSDAALSDRLFLSHPTTTVTGLLATTQYVFNIFAYDAYGNRASGTTEMVATTIHAPATPNTLNQYHDDAVTAIGNNTWTSENDVYLTASSSDIGTNQLSLYYQLATSSGSYIVPTSTPSGACSSGTAYASCPSKVWVATSSSWYNSSYPYRARITVQAGKVAGAQTNFPIYFNLARLGASNPFWGHTRKKSDGGDLVVTAADGLTREPLEIVAMSTSSQTGEIYFRADSLSASANTIFYIYYGSSTAAQPANNSAYGSINVWSNNYYAVYHLNATAAGVAGEFVNSASSTSNARGYGTTQPSRVAGVLGYGQSFTTGQSQYILDSAFNWKPNGPITISFWETTAGGNMNGEVAAGNPDSGTDRLLVTAPYSDNTFYWDYGNISGAGHLSHGYTNYLNNWEYVTVLSSGNGNTLDDIRVNGSSIASTTSSGYPTVPRSGLYLGGYQVAAQYSTSQLDEVRISNVTRANTWTATEYNNQKSPGTFFATTSEQSAPSATQKMVNITAIPDFNGYKWQVIACDANGCSRAWKQFNASVPNFKVNNVAPTLPGALVFAGKNSNSVKFNFGSQTNTVNFSQYKIFYKQGSSGVRTTDTLWGSSSEASLKYIDFNTKSSTTITGLTNGLTYVFNIFAYDGFGRIASSANEVIVALTNGPSIPYGLQQYYWNSNVLGNGSWIGSSSVILSATSSDANQFLMYYELLGSGSSFITATNTPANACMIGVTYGNCASKVWVNGSSTAYWYNTSFPYRVKISAKAAQVAATQTNFPVYFDLSHLGPASTFWGHTRKKSDGGDFIVTNSNGTTRLPLEVVSVSTTSYTGEIYFRADTISSAADTGYYLYYGSSTASQPASTTAYGSQNVWSNGYKGVWHFKEAASATVVRDSTSYNNKSASFGGTPTLGSAGKLGNSVYFNGTSRILVPESTSLEPVHRITYSVWVNSAAAQNTWAKPFWYGENNTGPYYGVYGFEYNNGSATNVECRITSGGAGYSTPVYATATGVWHYMVGSYDGANLMFYDNGTYQQEVAIANATIAPYDATNGLGIGDKYQTGQGYTGYIDEIRIASTTRSAAWISTEYNNQNNPASFFTTSSEQSAPLPPQKTLKISGMPDSSTGYKWHSLACDINTCSGQWKSFNVSTPNFKVDTVAPTAPGQLTLVSRRTNSITLGFGSASSEANFKQYKIFYKPGTTGVKESDSLFGSTSDPSLNSLTYAGDTTFTINGLVANTQYVFNIWAYDQVGNKASSTSVTFQTSNALTQLYYYTSGDSQGWINPALAWDHTNGTYAYRNVPANSVDDSANYLQGTANNVALTSQTILGVELGLKGYVKDPNNETYKIIPMFNGGATPGSIYSLAGSLFGRSDSGSTFYTDITDDGNAPAQWTWSNIINLDAKAYALNASSSVVTDYVDQIGLRVTVDSYPNNPAALNQYKSDKVTAITNGAYFNQKNIVLSAAATDPDPSEALSVYYEFIPAAQSFTVSTNTPAGACTNLDTYASCDSKIWVSSYTGAPANFSVTPFIATSSLNAIPDGAYKWQALVCDGSAICSSWQQFNVTTPDITIDTTAPTVPGKLTFVSHNSGTITLHFGTQSADTNFYRYQIFYKKGSTTPVTESDLLQSDTNLNFANFNGAVTSTVAGLAKKSWYTFNIWAYDLAGNKASATVAMIASTTSGYVLTQTSYVLENDDSLSGVDFNTAAVATSTALTNVKKGQRLNARFQIQNTGTDQTYNKRFKIQYENNTDGPNTWNDVGMNTPISYANGLSGANGDPITRKRAATNANTWSNGFWQEYTNLTNMYNLPLNHYTEFVFALQTANATLGKTYRLRLIDGTGSSTLDTYSAYPTVSITGNDFGRDLKDNLLNLPVNNLDVSYYLDNPGYTALAANDSNRDIITSSAGNYPLYNFVSADHSSAYALNASWVGQSSVAPTTNPVTLQVYRFGSVNAWVNVASNTAAALNTDFTLNGTIDYHLSDYLSGSYVFWRVYQAAGAETLSSNYFSFTTSTPIAYVTDSHYRWANDDAAYGSWRELQDTPDPTLGTAINKNTNIRLRLSFTNTQAGSATNYGFGLQYSTTTTNCSGTLSPWYQVRSTATSTLQFQIALSPRFANGSSTSAHLSTDGYTYVAGNMVNYAGVTSSAITLAQDNDTEVEWSIKATANAKAGQTYCFRGTKNNAALDAYSRYAELTIGGTTNTAPSFTAGPSDNGSATSTPTNYGQNVTFSATSTDPQGDQYYLAICQTNAIVAGNGGAPTCSGGAWCVSGRASSTKLASCTASTAHLNAEYYAWYAFACDYRYGAGIAKCSAMSQGAVPRSPNASTFRVNHPPSFSAITTLNDFGDPGRLFNIQATTADSDSGSNWSYFVCTTNAATAGGCTGSTICSVTATTTANPICHYQTSIPSANGTFTYYGFVYDNFSLAATTSPIVGSYNVNNVAPSLGSLSLNGGSNITLNIKGAPDTTVAMIDNSVTDLNGCQTLVSASGVVYRTGLGYNCSTNDNNCYQAVPYSCVVSNCSGSNDAIATLTCSVDLKFFAEPTDNSTNNPWVGDSWSARLQVFDGSNYSATTSPTVEVNTNSALDVSRKLISFGSVNPGSDTGTTNQTSTVINFGNSPLNSNVAGSDLKGVISGTLASTYIHWNLTQDFNYPSGSTLKNGGEVVTVNIAKPTSQATSSNNIYWGVGIPAVVTHTTFKGTSTFTAILNSSGW